MSALKRVSQQDVDLPESEVGLEHLSLDDAGPKLQALSSTTAQSIFVELSREAATATELADRIDTSLQNVGYHISRLDDAGLLRVVDTRYSAKGREMKVYARTTAGFVIGGDAFRDDS